MPTALTLLCRASMSNPPTLPLPSSPAHPNKGRAPGLLPWLPHACSLPLPWEIARIKSKCLRIPRILPLKKKKTLTAQKNLFPQSRIEPVPPAVKTRRLNHWTVREVLSLYLHLCISLILLPFSAMKLGCCSSCQSLKVLSCFTVKRSNSWSL